MSATAESSPTSRRRAETVARLVEAANEVIAEKGFQRASLDEIAARAGLTKGAIYSNFGSKEDLFLAVAATHTAGFKLQLAPDVGLRDNFARLLDSYVAAFPKAQAHAAFNAEFMLYALTHEAMRERWEEGFADAISGPAPAEVEAYLKRSGRPSAKAFRVILHAMSTGLALQRALTPDLVTEDVVRAAFELLAGKPDT
ncbi:MAG TPA: helix-turn-helix domain-containing protein [Caulobacteraceae bacterium]|nr:helix-turn-helix domain-containing protein [Caulobacteraceae bacterium]